MEELRAAIEELTERCLTLKDENASLSKTLEERNAIAAAACRAHCVTRGDEHFIRQKLFNFVTSSAQDKTVDILRTWVKSKVLWHVTGHIQYSGRLEDLRDASSATLLHVATQKNKLDIMRCLVEDCDVPVNAVDAFGRTPLHVAAFAKREPTIQLLVDLGADRGAKDLAGLTPASYIWNSVPITGEKKPPLDQDHRLQPLVRLLAPPPSTSPTPLSPVRPLRSSLVAPSTPRALTATTAPSTPASRLTPGLPATPGSSMKHPPPLDDSWKEILSCCEGIDDTFLQPHIEQLCHLGSFISSLTHLERYQKCVTALVHYLRRVHSSSGDADFNHAFTLFFGENFSVAGGYFPRQTLALTRFERFVSSLLSSLSEAGQTSTAWSEALSSLSQEITAVNTAQTTPMRQQQHFCLLYTDGHRLAESAVLPDLRREPVFRVKTLQLLEYNHYEKSCQTFAAKLSVDPVTGYMCAAQIGPLPRKTCTKIAKLWRRAVQEAMQTGTCAADCDALPPDADPLPDRTSPYDPSVFTCPHRSRSRLCKYHAVHIIPDILVSSLDDMTRSDASLLVTLLDTDVVTKAANSSEKDVPRRRIDAHRSFLEAPPPPPVASASSTTTAATAGVGIGFGAGAGAGAGMASSGVSEPMLPPPRVLLRHGTPPRTPRFSHRDGTVVEEPAHHIPRKLTFSSLSED